MDELLTLVLDAHGGLERWSGVSALTAHLSFGGPFWGAKGWLNVLSEETLDMDAHREHLVYTPFTAPDRSSVFDVDPERVTIQTIDGEVIERRIDPRASFAGYDRSTPWDAVQVAYFSSYATWNYLTGAVLVHLPRRAGSRDRTLAGGGTNLAPPARHLPQHHRHPQSQAGLLLRRRGDAAPHGLRP
jgi:hypothetical protein